MNQVADARSHRSRWVIVARGLRLFSTTRLQHGFVIAGFLIVLVYTGLSVFGAVSSILASRADVRAGATLRPGDTFPAIAGFDVGASAPLVVAVLRSNCVYCSRSFAFYRQLIVAKETIDFTFLALCTDSEPVCTRYVSNGGLAADRVASTSSLSGELKVAGTPTLLLIDYRGTIRSVWTGWQNIDGQRNILRAVEALTTEHAVSSNSRASR
jgi:hypothetical protein